MTELTDQQRKCLKDIVVWVGGIHQARVESGLRNRLAPAEPVLLDRGGLDAGRPDERVPPEPLALIFADRPREAIERLAEVELLESSPSDCAWATYAGGEALSALGEPDAADAYLSAIDLARSVGNPFVVSVSQVSLASEYSRAGSHRQALDAFAECLHAYARHGNYVHAVTSLRNMIEVLAAVGDNHGAVVIGAATSNALLRKSYGPEAERLADVLVSVERRVEPHHTSSETLCDHSSAVPLQRIAGVSRAAQSGAV